MKKLMVFDLDGTLAESKASLDAEKAGSEPETKAQPHPGANSKPEAKVNEADAV